MKFALSFRLIIFAIFSFIKVNINNDLAANLSESEKIQELGTQIFHLSLAAQYKSLFLLMNDKLKRSVIRWSGLLLVRRSSVRISTSPVIRRSHSSSVGSIRPSGFFGRRRRFYLRFIISYFNHLLLCFLHRIKSANLFQSFVFLFGRIHSNWDIGDYNVNWLTVDFCIVKALGESLESQDSHSFGGYMSHGTRIDTKIASTLFLSSTKLS